MGGTDELVDFPTGGRVYGGRVLVGPGATTSGGRARLDALAEWLQQIAYEDVVDAGLEHESLWVLRRTRLGIQRFPVFGERLTVRTACSGIGALVAERRTSFVGDRGATVEAAALWVPLDPETLRPRHTPGFTAVYGPAAGGRRVRARLHHPHPDADPRSGSGRRAAVEESDGVGALGAGAGAEASRPWRFVAADLDVAGHVNNAAYWRALEEELAALDAGTVLDVELEHHAPTQAGPVLVRRRGGFWWLLGEDDGQLRASARLTVRSTATATSAETTSTAGHAPIA